MDTWVRFAAGHDEAMANRLGARSTHDAVGSRPFTVGVLTPHSTPGPEIEIPAMSSGRVGTRVSRIGRPSTVDEAAAALVEASIDALAYASTSSGYVIGFDAEADMVQRLRDRWALPATSSSWAAVHALQAYEIERVAVIHPPWFDDETNDLGAAYFRAQGFDAVALRADSLPDDPADVRPGPVTDWVTRHLVDETEAVFLGGNGFHAAEAVDPIERRTGRLVLESNQVLLWSILEASRTTLDITGYGRLLRDAVPVPKPTGLS